MTTLSPLAPVPAEAPTSPAPARTRFNTIVHSEWIKFRSVRSSWMTLLGAGVATVAFGMIFSSLAESGTDGPGPTPMSASPVDIALGGVGLTEMIIGVLGVMVAASEYSTGLIRTTLASAGRRSRVIAAKATVVGGSVFALAAAAATAAIVAGQAVYSGSEATVALTDSLDVIVGTSVYLTGIALIGLAAGFILRSTAAGIATLVGGVFIGPNLLGLLPDSITDVFWRFLPSQAGSVLTSTSSNPDLLSETGAYAALAAWVAGLLALATVAVQRRDA